MKADRSVDAASPAAMPGPEGDPAVLHWRDAIPAACVFAVGATTEAVAASTANGGTVPVSDALRDSAIDVLFIALPFAVAFGICVALARRFPFGRGLSRRGWMLHAAGALISAGTTVTARIAATMTGKPPLALWLDLGGNLVLYFAVSAAVQVSAKKRRDLEEEAAWLAMRAELADARREGAEAQLRAVRADLNSRVLLEQLGALKELMRTNIGAADRVLGRLGELLRNVVARGGARDVSLQEELDALEPLLAVERARRGGRLIIVLDAPREVLDALVPSLVLQSLLENAVERGMDTRPDGRIHVSARRTSARGERLELAVAGSGGAGGAGGAFRVEVPWREGEGEGAVERPDPAAAIEETGPALLGHGDDEVRLRAPMGWTGNRVAWSAVRIGLCLLFGVGSAVQQATNHLRNVRQLGRGPLPLYVQDAAIDGCIMVLVFITAIWLAERAPWRGVEGSPRYGTWWSLRLHTLTGIAWGLVFSAYKITLVTYIHFSSLSTMKHLWRNVTGSIASMVALTFLFCGIAHLLDYLERKTWTVAGRMKLRAQVSETRRRRAEIALRALKAELNPHFVGNALTAVSALMRTDVEAAGRVVDQLGDLLRTVAAHVGTQEVTLGEELKTLEPFVAVERERYGRTLDVRWKVDAGALPGRVPHMILQPLVENAVKHGFAPRGGAGHIEVSARRGRGRLEIAVRDDGVGMGIPVPAGAPAGRGAAGGAGCGGVGLSNTRARLSELYGKRATFDIAPADGGGTIARVTIPWHEGAARAAAPAA
jgi:LytS/YehU family sensor histidine kinase